MVDSLFVLRRCYVSILILLVFAFDLTSTAAAQDIDASPPVEVLDVNEAGPPFVPDTTPPLVTQPPDLLIPAVDWGGAPVTFTLPTATDDIDGPIPVSCDREPGSLFPLGTATVSCSARDAAGNVASVWFHLSVVDQTAPVVEVRPDIYVVAPGSDGAVVDFVMPSATDNLDGAIAASCDSFPGSFFPTGVTAVTCWATDSTGNTSIAITFIVVVDAPPAPVPTETPSPALPTVMPVIVTPVPTPMPARNVDPEPTVAPPPEEGGVGQVATAPVVSATVTPALETTATAAPPVIEPPAESVPAALPLPWPPPSHLSIDPPGGPLNGIEAIWGYQDFPVSQEFGHTEFSISHFSWYSYGIRYGLDGFEHPGLDIGMPAGTWLYSPVEGTVEIAGGVRAYTYYGNWEPYVGQLLLVTDAGDEVVLGHMGRIAVNVGDRVAVGQFVGTSGGFNGDHLHLEVREVREGGWLFAVDPRESVIVESLEAAAREWETPEAVENATN